MYQEYALRDKPPNDLVGFEAAKAYLTFPEEQGKSHPFHCSFHLSPHIFTSVLFPWLAGLIDRVFDPSGVNLRHNYLTMMLAIAEQLERGVSSERLVGCLDDPKLRSSVRLFEYVSRANREVAWGGRGKQSLQAKKKVPHGLGALQGSSVELHSERGKEEEVRKNRGSKRRAEGGGEAEEHEAGGGGEGGEARGDGSLEQASPRQNNEHGNQQRSQQSNAENNQPHSNGAERDERALTPKEGGPALEERVREVEGGSGGALGGYAGDEEVSEGEEERRRSREEGGNGGARGGAAVDEQVNAACRRVLKLLREPLLDASPLFQAPPSPQGCQLL